MEGLINVVGLGYIGLPTALMLSSKGLRVIGTDYDGKKVGMLCSGEMTFKEDGLEELYGKARENGIAFTDEYQRADIYIVAVPTPFDRKSKKVAATYLVGAVEDIVIKCKEDSIIVIESTVSPGTIDTYIRPIVNRRNREAGFSIELAHAPERIIPGNMIKELSDNNRTIGADKMAVAGKIRDVYARFCNGGITLTDIRTAEMSKVVENAYRDINIAFANELVKICKAAGIDVYEIIDIANKHPRVNILSPGPGVGGHCISVDPWFLVGDYPGLANIILAARKINDSMPQYVLKRISEIMEEKGIASADRVGLYGLAYKENVDDVRESPTLQLLECMREHLADGLKVYDPYVKEDIVEKQYHDLDCFLGDIDFLVVMVGHDEIKDNAGKLKAMTVLDTRNVLSGNDIYKL